MVKEDTVEAVIGLGANLFYNSPMEAMILVGNVNKPKDRKGKVLFINAKDDVINNKGLAYLKQEHIDKVYGTYKKFEDIKNYAKVVTIEEILSLNGNMNINFYIKRSSTERQLFSDVLNEWNTSGVKLNKLMTDLFKLIT